VKVKKTSGAKLLFMVLVFGLMAAVTVPAAAEEMIMLRGYPNIWVPKSKIIGDTQAVLPADRGLAAEEMIMLRGYPNIWVPKSRFE